MPEPSWSRVADTFDVADLDWTVVEVADGRDEVRVVPRLRVDAVHARLDAAVGVAGWSVSYAALPGGAVACHLVIGGVTKGAVAAPSLTGGGAATAAVALGLAAARFGARPPWPADASAWVACDPATLEPLHPPERPVGVEAARPAVPDPARPAVLEPELPDAAGPADATPAAGAAAVVAAAGMPTELVEAPAPKPEGQQIIDRLIERLKAEGQGLAAARILVQHGGYGKDPNAARELYRELRALLRAGAGERELEAAEAQVGRS